jgi:RNA polymerase sigma-70 factor (ECF subfamily)
MTDQSDEVLVARCLEGDTAAFDELVRRYEKPVFNGCLRMVKVYQDAQDVTQTVFLKAYQKLDTFDPGFRFFSWIYRMMINESLNFLARRRPEVEIDHQAADSRKNPEEVLVEEQVSSSLQEALMGLKEELRAVVVLRYFGDLSYRELSFVFDVPEKTIKSRLYTARQQLSMAMCRRGMGAHG